MSLEKKKNLTFITRCNLFPFQSISLADLGMKTLYQLGLMLKRYPKLTILDWPVSKGQSTKVSQFQRSVYCLIIILHDQMQYTPLYKVDTSS